MIKATKEIMTLEEFIEAFAEEFEDTEMSEFKADTEYKDLDEWDSLTALSIITMVDDQLDNMTSKRYQFTSSMGLHSRVSESTSSSSYCISGDDQITGIGFSPGSSQVR